MLENSSKEERTLINQFKAEKTRIIKATKEAEVMNSLIGFDDCLV